MGRTLQLTGYKFGSTSRGLANSKERFEYGLKIFRISDLRRESLRVLRKPRPGRGADNCAQANES
jgi:hypothetical protein